MYLFCDICYHFELRKEENVLFNDAIYKFCLKSVKICVKTSRLTIHVLCSYMIDCVMATDMVLGYIFYSSVGV